MSHTAMSAKTATTAASKTTNTAISQTQFHNSCWSQMSRHNKRNAVYLNPWWPKPKTATGTIFQPMTAAATTATSKSPQQLLLPQFRPCIEWLEKREGGEQWETTINKTATISTTPWAARKRKRRWLTESAAISGDEFFRCILRIYEPNHNICFMTFACNLKVILCKFPT